MSRGNRPVLGRRVRKEPHFTVLRHREPHFPMRRCWAKSERSGAAPGRSIGAHSAANDHPPKERVPRCFHRHCVSNRPATWPPRPMCRHLTTGCSGRRPVRRLRTRHRPDRPSTNRRKRRPSKRCFPRRWLGRTREPVSYAVWCCVRPRTGDRCPPTWPLRCWIGVTTCTTLPGNADWPGWPE